MMNNTPVAGTIEVNGKSYELPDKPVCGYLFGTARLMNILALPVPDP